MQLPNDRFDAFNGQSQPPEGFRHYRDEGIVRVRSTEEGQREVKWLDHKKNPKRQLN